ncbi:MAG: DUF2318 domain-containing protein [Candidatus Adiutrix sp.]|jgi:uncharacterized membrane protein|nr:DUF2318 domain-containing protein [Candidatus Adiutrix sp.]
MLFYLIRTIDAAWVLAIGAPLIVFALRRDDRLPTKRRLLWGAVALGLLDGLVYAYLRRNTGWVIREFYDLGVLWPFLPLALVWLIAARAALTPAGRPGRLLRWSGALTLFLLLARVLPDVFIYPLDFGIGLDSYFNLDYLSKCAGYLSGLLLMLLWGGAIGWLCRQAPLSAARWFVLASFFFLALDLMLEAGQIMFVRRMLPNIKIGSITPFTFINFFLNHKVYFILVQIALWGGLAAGLIIRSRVVRPWGANPALIRKSRYGLILSFRAGLAAMVCMGLVLLAVTSLRAIEARGPYIAEPEEVTAEEEELRLDLDIVGDGNLHRHMYKTENGVPMRFIVIKKTANAYGVGLDACDICGPTGYYQRGDQVICKLCDVVMNKSTIGFPGGCNPVPLKFRIEKGKIIIETADLEEEEHRFQ